MKNSIRSATAPRKRSARISASDNASGSLIRRLLRTAMPKARLANTALKLSKPTQLVGWPKPFQLKTEYQAASPTGTTTNSENKSSAGGRNKRIAVHLPASNVPAEARVAV